MSTSAAKRSYDPSKRRERAEQEREATRQRIIEAARALFVEQGYVETTVDAIAARAGVVKQTVYLAAGSKAQLLRAVEKLNGHVILPQSITESRQITLRPNENVFSIGFAALDFLDEYFAKLRAK